MISKSEMRRLARRFKNREARRKAKRELHEKAIHWEERLRRSYFPSPGQEDGSQAGPPSPVFLSLPPHLAPEKTATVHELAEYRRNQKRKHARAKLRQRMGVR